MLLDEVRMQLLWSFNVPTGLWSLVLERSNVKVDAIFHFLREQPNLLNGRDCDYNSKGYKNIGLKVL